MNGILIVNAGGYWVARANKYFTVTAPTAHAVVRMLKEISQEEELDYSALGEAQFMDNCRRCGAKLNGELICANCGATF